MVVMNKCLRCSTVYNWVNSHATLKMSYCGIFCEIGDLGFSIDAALTMRPGKPMISVPEVEDRTPTTIEVRKDKDNDDRKELVHA